MKVNKDPYGYPIINRNHSDLGVFYFTKKIYGDKAYKMLEVFDRNIAPELLEIGTFSYFFQDRNTKNKFFIDINNKKLLKKVLTEKFLSDKIRESLRCDKVNGL